MLSPAAQTVLNSRLSTDTSSNQPSYSMPSQNQKTIVKTGLYNGKKVVQYSDGTTDYAN